MYLNEFHPIFHDLMTQDIRIQHVVIHQGAPDAHGKQTVCVAAKRLAVEEISPPADDLPSDQSQHPRICHGRKRTPFSHGYKRSW